MSRALLLAFLLAPASAGAVDGISVTVHWSGVDAMFYGGFGEIWRHELRNSVVESRTKIYDGPARMVRISPTGKHVAFIKQDGTVAITGIKGGVVTDLAQAHPEGGLDWPHPDWIYFSTGGWSQPDTSRYIYRVNVHTGLEESVTVLDCGIWRVHVSADLTRAVFRAVSGCGSAGSIVAYDLVTNDGTLPVTRATDSPSCGEAFDAYGEYFADGMPSHEGFDIRRWDNLDIVETFLHTEATTWGGPDSGANHNRNGWAVNDQDWICVHLGWDAHWGSSCRGANQVLYNWVEHERIVVTENTEGSYTFDSAGDFWVGLANMPPEVYAGADQVVSLAAGATVVAVVQDDDPVTLLWELADGPSAVVFSTPDQLETDVSFSALGSYTLRLTADDGENAVSDEVLVTVADNGAPTVDAGVDLVALPGSQVLLEGDVVDDGLPDGNVDVLWTQVSGPSVVALTTPENATTLADFVDLGTYELRLSADDGLLAAEDVLEVRVVNNGPPQVDAGADIKVAPGGTVSLTGEVIDDGLPTAVGVTWSLVEGPGDLTFADAHLAATEATPELEGEYVVRLAAHDGELGAFDDVVVTVGPNAAPAVDAGGDQTVSAGGTLLLLGEVFDDGLPAGEVTIAWSQISGPASVNLTTPDTARCVAQFDVIGSYVLRLEASDGELSTYDEVSVTVGDAPEIVLLGPNGGEVWTVGQSGLVRWSAEGVEDVVISLSTDDGLSWNTLVPSVDTSSPHWGSYPVVVPNEPSDRCRIAVAAYIDGSGRAVSANLFTIAVASSPPVPRSNLDTGDGCGCAGTPSSALAFLGCMAWLVRRRRR